MYVLCIGVCTLRVLGIPCCPAPMDHETIPQQNLMGLEDQLGGQLEPEVETRVGLDDSQKVGQCREVVSKDKELLCYGLLPLLPFS